MLEVVIWFANLKRITSTAQVETRFAKAVGLGMDEFKEIRPDEVFRFERDRDDLKEYLRDIATGAGAADERQLVKGIDDLLKETLRVRLVGPAGAPRLEMRPDGVEATIALGLALLLDSTRGLRHRLGYCAWSECGLFNLNLETDRRGTTKHYCDGHRIKHFRELRKKRDTEGEATP